MITVLDWLESTASKFAANIICADAKKRITYADFVKNAQAIGSFLCKYEKCGNLWPSLWITRPKLGKPCWG